MQFLTVNQTTYPLCFGPVISNAGTAGPSTTALTGLSAPYLTTIYATSSGSTTTFVSAGNTAIKGQKLEPEGGTVANIGIPSYITGVSGSVITVFPAWPSNTASGDVAYLGGITVSTATASGVAYTFVSSTASLVVGQQIKFTTGTSGNIGLDAWVIGVTGSVYGLQSAQTLVSTSSGDTVIGGNLAVFLSKNGTAWAPPVGKLNEVGGTLAGKGYYSINGNATDENTLGMLLLHWDVLGSTAGISNESEYSITGFNFYNPIAQANLVQISGTAVTLDANNLLEVDAQDIGGVAAALDTNNYLKVDVQDWKGSTTTPFPTNFSLMAISASGYVGANLQQISGTTVVLDAHNLLEVDVQDWNGTPVPALTSVVIGQATTVITTDTVANGVSLLPGQYSLVSGTVIVGGYSIGQDPWTIVSGGVVDNSVPSGIVYVGPFLEMLLADRMGPYGVTYIAGQLEAKYYKQNGTTKVIDATTLINGSNQSTSRTTILSP